MNIIKHKSEITKWEQSNNAYTGNTLDGEKHSFALTPYHPIHKSVFKIVGIIYITDADTDFILDVEIKSIMQPETAEIKPTPKELYEAYLKARLEWNNLIVKESMKYKLVIWRQSPAVPYLYLEEHLKTLLLKIYHEN